MTPSPKKNLLSFTLAGVEELELFPTEADRLKAMEEIGESVKGWPMVAGIVISGFAAVAGNVGTRFLLGWLAPGLNRELHDLLSALVMIGTFLLVLRWLHRRGARHELRYKLIACGVPVCLGCGSLLRGLPPDSQRCPECGQAIDDHVRSLLIASEAGAESDSSVSRLNRAKSDLVGHDNAVQ